MTSRTFLGEKIEYLLRCADETLQVVRYDAGPGDIMAEGANVTRALRGGRRDRAAGGRRARTIRCVDLRSIDVASLMLAAPADRRATEVDRAAAAEAARAVHGSADVFAAPGVALAWGILRGATEAATLVVVRIAADRDAFGSGERRRRRSVHAARAAAPAADARQRPASTFACRARISPIFRAPSSACSRPRRPAPSDAPKLVVYYLGVPDTTPEFASATALETYLAARIAGAREQAAGEQDAMTRVELARRCSTIRC